MDAEIATYWRYIASSLDRMVECVAGLDEAELSWRPPADGANSLQVLTVHTFGNAEENVLGQLDREDVARDRESEFRAAAGAGTELEERWRSLRPRMERALEALDREALDRLHDHPRRETLSGREVLLVVARHAAEHLGQAELTRDLLRAAGDGGQSSGGAASGST